MQYNTILFFFQPVLYSYWRSSCSWRVRIGKCLIYDFSKKVSNINVDSYVTIYRIVGHFEKPQEQIHFEQTIIVQKLLLVIELFVIIFRRLNDATPVFFSINCLLCSILYLFLQKNCIPKKIFIDNGMKSFFTNVWLL